jgi:hypothetical protein
MQTASRPPMAKAAVLHLRQRGPSEVAEGVVWQRGHDPVPQPGERATRRRAPHLGFGGLRSHCSFRTDPCKVDAQVI